MIVGERRSLDFEIDLISKSRETWPYGFLKTALGIRAMTTLL